MNPNRSHTFIVEIDLQDAEDRVRWRSGSEAEGSVAEQFLRFLDGRLGFPSREHGHEDDDGDSEGDGRLRFKVEMHQPGRGWMPLTDSTPSDAIPINCRVHVSIFSAAGSSRSTTRSPATLSSAVGGGGNAEAPGSLAGVGAGGTAALSPGREKLLALPWRHFEIRDEDGLEVCGRKVLIEDVHNSDQGTGLFTWDGSVLLAKYMEHQRGSWPRRRRRRLPGRDSVSAPETQSRPLRVLELGCGTGLAGISAGLSLGRSQPETREKTGKGATSNQSVPFCMVDDSEVGDEDEVEVEVVLTDLAYALPNARRNVERNSSQLKDARAHVVALELDWTRPLPQEVVVGGEFDLILAADAVWLDELVEPLVETLERLTVGWVRVAEVDAVDPVLPEEGGVPLTRSAAGGCRESETSDMRIDDSEDGQSTPPIPSCPGDGRGMNLAGTRQSSALRRVSGRAQPRAVFAYQWRSERTGKALLRELGRAFHVREIGAEVRLVLRVSEMDLIGPVSLPAPWNTTVAVIEPERTLFSGRLECHPDFQPTRNLCLLEATRRSVP